jgi:predicted ATP-dependent serine protease
MAKINEIKLTGTDYEVIDIFKDLARKEAIYDEFGNRKLYSGLKPLDVVTGGGLETGQIAVINAPSGRGKSSFLSNLTYYYSMVAHHNVLHITLEELNTDQILRFDRIITNSDIHDVFTP